MLERIASRGAAGTQHLNAGRTPVNKLPQSLEEQLLALLKDRYYDFSIAHAHEKITKDDKLKVSYRSLLNLAITHGLRPAKKRRASKARKRRERFANQGMLLQMDGSHHRWNGVDEWCLIALIDDATSDLVYARFTPGETTGLV